MLSENFKNNYKKIVDKFENKQSAILALLHEIQKEKNYIKEEEIAELANILNLPYSRIKAVATFYTMYNLKETGKYHLQICRNLSCHMAGSLNLIKFVEEKLKIKEGQMTKDGIFSFSTVECLGACGFAPVIMVNETYHENMNEEKLIKLIEDLKNKK